MRTLILTTTLLFGSLSSAATYTCSGKGESLILSFVLVTDNSANQRPVSLKGQIKMSDNLREFRNEWPDAPLSLENLTQFGIGKEGLILGLHVEVPPSQQFAQKIIYDLNFSAKPPKESSEEGFNGPYLFTDRFNLVKFVDKVQDVQNGQLFASRFTCKHDE